jgi:hypothetical protein
MGRVGGIISFKIDGVPHNAKGSFTYGYGVESRETILGSDRVHGYKSMVTAPFVEGEITDVGDLDIKAFSRLTDCTVLLELGNGKIFALYHAWNLNQDGISGETEEGNIAFRFEGTEAKDVT